LLLRPRPASLLGESGEAEPDDGMGVTIGLSGQDLALRPASSGAAIRDCQLQLNRVHADLIALGLPGLPFCPLEADGRFNGRMAQAVRAFKQQVFDNPSQWDAVIDAATKAKLDQLAGPAAMSTVPRADIVDGLPKPLNALPIEARRPPPCGSDLSDFGIARREQDIRRGRLSRPQLVAGRPLCAGGTAFDQSGPDASTIDLLLWNFDIDGAYTKDRLIYELHRRLVGRDGAMPAATSYRRPAQRIRLSHRRPSLQPSIGHRARRDGAMGPASRCNPAPGKRGKTGGGQRAWAWRG
jgi:hypothetical protein